MTIESDKKVNCGCYYPIKNLKTKDMQRILDLARQEEIEKTERLIAGLGIFKREVKVDE